jgi:hypothetical protein
MADGTPNYCGTLAAAQWQWADWKSFSVANNDVLVGWNWWANSALVGGIKVTHVIPKDFTGD